MARIGIGMPVYNGARTLPGAIECILDQSFRDFELVISDNASTDETREICEEYAARDERIRYVRQPVNLGAEANFFKAFAECRAEFFMWAAADDLRSSDFLALNLQFLLQHPDYVASTCRVRFEGGDFDPVQMGDQSLMDGDPCRRVRDFFSCWHANGRYYSLCRREAVAGWSRIQKWFFLGGDWTLVTHLATQGKLNRVDSGWVELGRQGMSNTTDMFARYRSSPLHWMLPFGTLSVDTLIKMRRAHASDLYVTLRRLARLNYVAFREQIRWYRRTRRT